MTDIRLPMFADSPGRLADWMQPVLEGGAIKVMRTPRNVDLAITGKCNLRCKTCFYADEMVALSNLPTDQWLELFEELGRMGIMTVLLTGGEPMTHPDILELIDGLVANGMRFRLNSNGMLLSHDNVGHIKASGRCDVVQISIDGSCPEVHDAIRGCGSFEGAVRGIRLLQEHGVAVTVRVTINRLNLHDLSNIFVFLFDELGLTSVSCNEAFPRGAGQCNIKDLDMSAVERRQAERICIEAQETYPSLSAQAGPLVNARQREQVRADLLKSEGERARTKGTLSACGVASQNLSVLHDGTVVPCHQLPHMELGRVGVDELETIWHESVALHYLRTRHRIPLGQLEECHDCRYQPYCTGGCPALAYSMTGKMTGRSPRDCLRALCGEDDDYAF